MSFKFILEIVPGKFYWILCRECNQTETAFSGDYEKLAEKFQAEHAHLKIETFDKDRFVNSVIGKFGE